MTHIESDESLIIKLFFLRHNWAIEDSSPHYEPNYNSLTKLISCSRFNLDLLQNNFVLLWKI